MSERSAGKRATKKSNSKVSLRFLEEILFELIFKLIIVITFFKGVYGLVFRAEYQDAERKYPEAVS